jgi:hypothetical protein
VQYIGAEVEARGEAQGQGEGEVAIELKLTVHDELDVAENVA